MVQSVSQIIQDAQVDTLKVPPHSMEAEQSVVGGLMLENAAWDRIADLISDSDFYRADHRLIFSAVDVFNKKLGAVLSVFTFLLLRRPSVQAEFAASRDH